MPQYVQKRPTCEARQITAETAADVAAWCGGMVLPDGGIMYPTAEVGLIAPPGRYLVKRPGADFVQMKPEDFEAQWESAE